MMFPGVAVCFKLFSIRQTNVYDPAEVFNTSVMKG